MSTYMQGTASEYEAKALEQLAKASAAPMTSAAVSHIQSAQVFALLALAAATVGRP